MINGGCRELDVETSYLGNTFKNLECDSEERVNVMSVVKWENGLTISILLVLHMLCFLDDLINKIVIQTLGDWT